MTVPRGHLCLPPGDSSVPPEIFASDPTIGIPQTLFWQPAYLP
jgi:hypothetical protein